MLLTDVAQDNNAIRVLGSDSIMASDWADFSPEPIHFGATGQGDGEFLFPNDALVDSQGRVYVSDGNNGRISIWDSQGSFQYNFGVGTGDGALSLPRGMDIDANDRLYVADAVGQHIVVYDVSGENPVFLYAFGSFGMADGQFNYPNDIVSGPGGRLYIVDRENNRIQVWLY
jgi:DNA-binding beta-propeller fold protein YncE